MVNGDTADVRDNFYKAGKQHRNTNHPDFIEASVILSKITPYSELCLLYQVAWNWYEAYSQFIKSLEKTSDG